MQPQAKATISDIPTTSTDPATPATPPPEAVAAIPQVIYRVPFWASLAVALNGLLLLAISIAYWKPHLFGFADVATSVESTAIASAPESPPEEQSIPYEQWLDILGKEAQAVAQQQPERLTVLLGDSLTLWFPPERLSDKRQWLNQGISGENTTGLLKRLNLLESLKPQTLFVMIGVNDLIQGSDDTQLLERYQKMIEGLKSQQPQAEIVVQSILPHGGDRLTVDNRAQVLQVSNERIVQLNRQLEALAKQQEVNFLDLVPVFTDRDGLLRSELSTDGLHLNTEGYTVWQAAMQMFDQLELKPPVVPADSNADVPSEDVPEATPDALSGP